MLEDMLEIIKKNDLTIFYSHNSKILKLLNDKKITLGIHPNIQKNRSQGKNLNVIRKFLKKSGFIQILKVSCFGSLL